MPPRSHTHAAAAFSPRKTRSGRKQTNSVLSDLSVKAPKKRREADAEQEEETETTEKRNTGNDGPKPPKGKQQRKTSAVKANEDAEASARASNTMNMTRNADIPPCHPLPS
ncbi:hypothetical protein M378DRAFT_182724 [Amanita muscaria Koide BX008]|uniref:Uncharacterized protein n=1 Tax=Amanita muscaria (strain Koide BX008) TaxID=946122 RepID=A0A0C2RUE3_AMAMK|nr:hypothetical protein M378DRAFT_182724 [Amanita muscaria Koide BX008]